MSSTDIKVTPHTHQFGARITGVDLSQPLSPESTQAIRKAWLDHQVIYFPDQPLDHQQLERFTRSFGAHGQ